MLRHAQGSYAVAGAIAAAIFVLIFVAILVLGNLSTSVSAVVAALVAIAAAVVLYRGLDSASDGPGALMAAPAAKAAPVAAAEVAPAQVAAQVTEAPISAGDKPAGLEAPRDGKADDLKRIKGVGPKLEKLLNSMGYWHLDQIANWSVSDVAWVDANLTGFKGRVSRDNWVEQARDLAGG